ncbi:MAG: ribonuclease HIII [Planctomycetes bacterium]|nr:ribonuclease HIII [Planctomycetota bacterium]
MAQKTLVLQLSNERAREVQRRLTSAAFEFRSAPHALFSAKGAGVVATHYTSGKLVIQGEDPEAFVLAFVEHDGAAPASRAAKPAASDLPRGAAETVVGSDESGKGDYFGPLVVAAVRLEPELSKRLEGGEVRDCKSMSDEAVLRVGGALRAKVPFAVARLDPPSYNAEHARVGNLNPMLARLHAEAIGRLATPGMHVIVDQFGNASLLDNALAHLSVRLEQRPRAEELLAVAAASVIAREQFLIALHELSESFAVDLAKGAGEPVDRAARAFVALHGIDKLGSVAKLHFKNTQKLARNGKR